MHFFSSQAVIYFRKKHCFVAPAFLRLSFTFTTIAVLYYTSFFTCHLLFRKALFCPTVLCALVFPQSSTFAFFSFCMTPLS